MKQTWSITVKVIILSIVLGGASGIFMTALTTNYLSDYAVELGELTAPLRLAEERPRLFPGTYAEAVDAVVEKSLPAVVEFYPATLKVDVPSYNVNNLLSTGALLTSDGWIAAYLPPSALSSFSILINGKNYKAEKVLKDAATGISFVKVSIEEFPVLAFGSGWNVELGDQLFLIPFRNSIIGTSVTEIVWQKNTLLSSDIPSRRVVVQGEHVDVKNGIVLNLSGELVGFLEPGSDHSFLPIEGIMPAFNAFLREGEIARPSLGVNRIDLKQSVALSEDITSGRDSGALLYGWNAVRSGSAAQKAGLKMGDIILSVDGQSLNGNRVLDEYITQYRPDDKVLLTIDREGEIIEVEVTLTTF